MIKDRFIHEKLGIPIQTLQNWKRSEGYTFLLYQFLKHQDEDLFKETATDIAKLYKYELMKAEDFAKLVKEHWGKFDFLSDYVPIDPVSSKSEDDSQVLLAATYKHDENSKKTLLLNFVSGVSKQKKLFETGLNKINTIYTKGELKKPKIIYIATTATEPKYFGEYDQELSLISYAELFEKISAKKILIV